MNWLHLVFRPWFVTGWPRVHLMRLDWLSFQLGSSSLSYGHLGRTCAIIRTHEEVLSGGLEAPRWHR